MFKNIDKKVLLFLVSVQIIVITVSNFLVSLPLEIYGIKLTWSEFGLENFENTQIKNLSS